MIKLISSIIALVIKVAIVFYLVKFGVSFWNPDAKWYLQNIFVWLMIYIPVFAGYETIVSMIAKEFTKTKSKQETTNS